MKELILGYGVTGRQLASYLTKDRDPDLFIYDNDPALQREWRELPNHLNQYHLRDLPDRQQLKSYDMVYVSPGFNLKKLYSNGEFEGISFKTDLDIFLQKNDSFKIGITGTNGKSTCCYHLSQILEDSQLMGNFGNGVLHYCYTGQKYSIIEISSFQLEKIKEVKLDLGVLLNIAPDHIDFHGTFEEYQRVKNRIKEAKVFTEESNPWALLSLITGEYPKRKDLENLPHRFEVIHVTKGRRRCPYINDSKSTNLASLEFALDKMSHSYYLFLCGDPNKEQYKNYKIIGPEKVIIFGQHAREIYKRTSHPKKILLHNQDLRSAFHAIAHDDYEAILFSPGHPSGKDYNNFEERGDHFKELVQNIFDD